jgi:hypothetical protein
MPIRKRPPPVQPRPVSPRQQPEERRIPPHGGRTVTSRIVKPVGAALFLFALAAHAQQTITAPQGGQGACPFPGCAVSTTHTVISDPPFNVQPSPTTNQTAAIQRAIDACSGTLVFPPGIYLVCGLVPRCAAQRWTGSGVATILRGTSGCANVVVTALTSGPALRWELDHLRMDSVDATTTSAIGLNAGRIATVHIHDVEFLSAGTLLVTGGGAGSVEIDHNTFRATPAPSGAGHTNGINLFRGVTGASIHHNTFSWPTTTFSSTAKAPSTTTSTTTSTTCRGSRSRRAHEYGRHRDVCRRRV